jgi:hypothetical protein
MAKQAGAAFGAPESDWRDADKSGYELQSPYLSVDLSSVLEPELIDKLVANIEGVALTASGIYAALPGSAQKTMLSAAVNDVMAVIRHVLDMDGRSAAHSARVLFEHVVNLYDVSNSTTNSPKRYLDHKAAVDVLVAGRTDYLALLRGTERKKERLRLDRLKRRATVQLARAVRQYGSTFKRQWAQGTLLDRAKSHGLESHYNGYRILSAVIHGSSGSMTGLVREIKGERVHRTGSDLELAAVALYEGLSFFLLFIEKVSEVTDVWEARHIAENIRDLINDWPTIRAGLQKLDRKIWPTAPTPGPMAVLALYPSGERWYYYHTATQSLILAHPPSEDVTAVSELRTEYAKRYDPTVFNGRPMTAVVSGVRVEPKEGQRPFPMSAIMVPAAHPAPRLRPNRTKAGRKST